VGVTTRAVSQACRSPYRMLTPRPFPSRWAMSLPDRYARRIVRTGATGDRAASPDAGPGRDVGAKPPSARDRDQREGLLTSWLWSSSRVRVHATRGRDAGGLECRPPGAEVGAARARPWVPGEPRERTIAPPNARRPQFSLIVTRQALQCLGRDLRRRRHRRRDDQPARPDVTGPSDSCRLRAARPR
jgi:hypothetical protein